MRTIPDTLDIIKNKFDKVKIKVLDCFYSICESVGSKLNVWSWHKRWNNRKTGTGYKDKK